MPLVKHSCASKSETLKALGQETAMFLAMIVQNEEDSINTMAKFIGDSAQTTGLITELFQLVGFSQDKFASPETEKRV